MVKNPTKQQQATLDKMRPGAWYSAANLDVRNVRMFALEDMGLVIPHPDNAEWGSAYRLRRLNKWMKNEIRT